MFLDEAIITVTGGTGGNGFVGWRREKYIAKGGPNGGDGGDGGCVSMQADANTDTLSSFASQKKYKADDGSTGARSNRHGKSGDDLILSVPPGTILCEVSDAGLPLEGGFRADLRQNGDQVLLVRGGRGGYGNAHFKSSTRQRPDFAEKGEPGKFRKLHLELKLVADVGIIGLPNAGKSTLISVISSARPKIADYEFTTIVPNLGVVHVDNRSYIACDIPGLVEGAHEGKGLGGRFLRHIERCSLLVHLLDVGRSLKGTEPDPGVLLQNYRTIRRELETYSPTLAAKQEVVVLNKIDLAPHHGDATVRKLREIGIPIFRSISAATCEGVDSLKKELLPLVLRERAKRQEVLQEDEETLPILTPHLEGNLMGAYRISKERKTITVCGRRLEQFTVMTDFENEGGRRRFRDVCERIGLLRALRREGMNEKTLVYIGTIRVDEYL